MNIKGTKAHQINPLSLCSIDYQYWLKHLVLGAEGTHWVYQFDDKDYWLERQIILRN